MPYRINGTDITIPPTTGRWLPRERVGIDGSGHPIYSAVREFEMRWSLLSMSDSAQLEDFFQSVETTGTAVVTLPRYGNSSWAYYDYSGCTLSEPEFGDYFSEYAQEVFLLVMNIWTAGTE